MDLKLNGLVLLKHQESESHKEAVKRLTEVPKQNRDVGDFCTLTTTGRRNLIQLIC